LAKDFGIKQERTLRTLEVAWGIARFHLDLSTHNICPSGLLVATNDKDEGLALACNGRNGMNGLAETQVRSATQLSGILIGNTRHGSLLLRLDDGAQSVYLTVRSSSDRAPSPSPSDESIAPDDHSTEQDPTRPSGETQGKPTAESSSENSAEKVTPFLPFNIEHRITKAWEHDRERSEIKNAIVLWSQKSFRKRMQAFLRHAQPNLPVLIEAMQAHDVPNETIFITLIESRYFIDDDYPIEISSAGALGPWQFIASTAAWDFLGLKVFSLRKTPKGPVPHPCDERADLRKSSLAAAKYFAYLYDSFPNDPKLAIMSYNWGKNNVNDALKEVRSKKGASRMGDIRRMGLDFWAVKEFNLAPTESIDYVIKFVAGQFVGREPTRYGLELPNIKSNPVAIAEPVVCVGPNVANR
jgi:hypothetical protein